MAEDALLWTAKTESRRSPPREASPQLRGARAFSRCERRLAGVTSKPNEARRRAEDDARAGLNNGQRTTKDSPRHGPFRTSISRAKSSTMVGIASREHQVRSEAVIRAQRIEVCLCSDE